ncbi:hypothetical protein Tco_0791674 [Tanacetum coccineum]
MCCDESTSVLRLAFFRLAVDHFGIRALLRELDARTNRRIRVPAFMRSYRIEEELILVKTFGKEVEEYVTKVITKDVYAKNGFAPHRIPQPKGNHNGWLSEEEEADSDSESTTSNRPHTG